MSTFSQHGPIQRAIPCASSTGHAETTLQPNSNAVRNPVLGRNHQVQNKRHKNIHSNIIQVNPQI